MSTLRLIELIMIGFTALIGGIGVNLFCWYNYRKNIYTQKILYLNEQLRKLTGKSLTSFQIGVHVKFQPKLRYEDYYPPTIYQKYVEENLNYKQVWESFDRLGTSMDKTARVLIYIYIPGISILGLLYLIHKVI
ncbi:hypothetical protein [Chondrinema litorale]|uniref:hypothetical protein n=1 Tax=Chondrinema litorale TaxID=2994555 RepID=UPI0025437658|nr:hypothetical protein [Chondrinema litorale]UZR97136.1 hypothetical protein OQ292_23855 [Chondrinema litorale]